MFVDGRPLPDVPEGPHAGVAVLYASRAGANGADDRMIAFIEVHRSPATLSAITSDRDLAARARALGSHVYGANTLLEQFD